MAEPYFSYFPTLLYSLDDTNINPQVVTNILARSAFLKEIIENTSIYYEYEVKDTDTPEIIADKLYGSPTRHWIVLLFNKILNPQYEFPLDRESLENYIKNKYSQTINQSLTTIHHYELRVEKALYYNSLLSTVEEESYTVSDKVVDFDTGAISNRSVPGTADTYIDLGTETIVLNSTTTLQISQKVYAVSNYTYEVNLNEERRTIKLLDQIYIPRIESQFKKLMSNG